jgi:hypothetical protein
MLEDPPNLLDFAPQTPPSMAAAVMKSLNKELDDRFASMEDFRKGLLGEIKVAGTASKAPGMAKRPAATAAGMRPVNVAATMSPQAQSTTLSSATSEIDDELGPPKKKTGLFVGVGVAVAAAAAIAFVVIGKSGDAPKPAAAVAAPAPAPVAPPAPPPKTTVTVRFEASPAGSHVFRKSDNKDLGAAPLDVKLPHNGPSTDYVLRKDGYKEFAVTADLSEDNTVHVALEKNEAPPPPVVAKPEPEKKKVSGGKKGGGKRRGGSGVPDEDGLATPSF